MSPTKPVCAVFPGVFDPITNGHLDVIHRGIKVFDRVIVAVGANPDKTPLFTPAERVDMIAEQIAEMDHVEVQAFDGLVVDFARTVGAQVILRGLRNLTDVQYEFQLAMTNRAIGGIETMFIMTSEEYGFTSSTLIREVARFGGEVDRLVPPNVYAKLKAKLKTVDHL